MVVSASDYLYIFIYLIVNKVDNKTVLSFDNEISVLKFVENICALDMTEMIMQFWWTLM